MTTPVVSSPLNKQALIKALCESLTMVQRHYKFNGELSRSQKSILDDLSFTLDFVITDLKGGNDFNCTELEFHTRD